MLLVVLVLAIWPARFTLESKGTLEPVVRQDVFAGIDGVVQELYCAHGDTVAKDKTLVLLRNTDLEVAIADVQGQRMANNEKLFAVQRALVEEKKLSIEERNRLAGEQAEMRQKQQTLDAQWGLYKAKQQELDVKSPIGGLVVTWDLRNRLIHRPVQRGQVLLRVADPDGPWQLELHMPENRMGHIVERQQELYDASRKKLRRLVAGRHPSQDCGTAVPAVQPPLGRAEPSRTAGGCCPTGSPARRMPRRRMLALAPRWTTRPRKKNSRRPWTRRWPRCPMKNCTIAFWRSSGNGWTAGCKRSSRT